METINLEITIGNETRTIEFNVFPNLQMGMSEKIFAARTYYGSKLHLVRGGVRLVNGEWSFHTNVDVLNKNGVIVEFADRVEFAKSQHNGTKIK
jgi:hypothetical protein